MVNDEKCIVNPQMIDPITKKNILGYMISDNAKVKICLSNHNIKTDAILLESYYFRNVKGRYIKIHSQDSTYVLDEEVDIIPTHTYRYLKNRNRLTDKIYVLDLSYDVKNDEIKNIINNKSSDNEIKKLKEQYDFYIDPTKEVYEKKHFKIYFSLVSQDEFDLYVKMIEEAKSKKSKKGGK